MRADCSRSKTSSFQGRAMCFHFISIVFNYSTPTSRQVKTSLEAMWLGGMICLKDYHSVNVKFSKRTNISLITGKGNVWAHYKDYNLVANSRLDRNTTIHSSVLSYNEAIIFSQFIICFIWTQSLNLPMQHFAYLLDIGIQDPPGSDSDRKSVV